MFLTDKDIKQAVEAGDITIKDFDESRLQPASYDVLLDNEFQVILRDKTKLIDPSEGIFPETRIVTIEDGEPFYLHPEEMVLARVRDFVGSKKYLIQLSGKSSLARVGLIVHNTAGIVNPGHFLQITLELANLNSVPIVLRPGMPIAQLVFSKMLQEPEQDYSEKGRFVGDNWKKNFTQ